MKKQPPPNHAWQICPPLADPPLTVEELRRERQTLKQELLELDMRLESLFDSLRQSMLPADATTAAPVIPATPSAEVAA